VRKPFHEQELFGALARHLRLKFYESHRSESRPGARSRIRADGTLPRNCGRVASGRHRAGPIARRLLSSRSRATCFLGP
jgi:hypothetical protein